VVHWKKSLNIAHHVFYIYKMVAKYFILNKYDYTESHGVLKILMLEISSRFLKV